MAYNVETFIAEAKQSVAYNHERKAMFHLMAQTVLRQLVKLLNLKKGEYDLRHNQGGIAVSGEITLHTDTLYVQIAQSCCGNDGFMWRTCKGRKDYSGGCNRWAGWEDLRDLESLAQRMKGARE